MIENEIFENGMIENKIFFWKGQGHTECLDRRDLV